MLRGFRREYLEFRGKYLIISYMVNPPKLRFRVQGSKNRISDVSLLVVCLAQRSDIDEEWVALVLDCKSASAPYLRTILANISKWWS